MNDIQNDANLEGFATRAASLKDADMIIDLINAAAMVDTGQKATTRDDKLNEWGLPQFQMETDTLLVMAPDGQAAAFVELWDSEPHVRHYLWGRVHPDYQGRGIGSYLVAWGERRARQSLHRAPPDVRVSLHTSAVQQNRAAHELFEEIGFSPSRYFFRMLIEMEPATPPPAPVWPAGVRVRPYILGQDDRAAHRTLDQAFRDHWGYVDGESFEEWFHWIENDPTFDPSVCFLAVTEGEADEEIVGLAMARPQWEQDANIAWIDELGVLRPWRRKGIARALLLQVFDAFHRRGQYKVGLAVDAGSLTGATGLYESAGMHVFGQLDAYQKILRPGRDMSIQALED